MSTSTRSTEGCPKRVRETFDVEHYRQTVAHVLDLQDEISSLRSRIVELELHIRTIDQQISAITDVCYTPDLS